jgi:hypothetical protein
MVRTSVKEAASAFAKFSGVENDICTFSGETNLAALTQLRIEFLRNCGFRFITNPNELPTLTGLRKPVDEGNLYICNSPWIDGLIEVHLRHGKSEGIADLESISLKAEHAITLDKMAIVSSPVIRGLIHKASHPIFCTSFVGEGGVQLAEDEESEFSDTRSILDCLFQMAKSFGFANCVEYTGGGKELAYSDGNNHLLETETVLDFMTRVKSSCMVASLPPVSTALDGLQKTSDLIIAVASPYTYANFVQLLGRIRRRGSKFSKVRMMVVIADYAPYDVNRWEKVIERKEGEEVYNDGKVSPRTAEQIQAQFELATGRLQEAAQVAVELPSTSAEEKMLMPTYIHQARYRRTYNDLATRHSEWSRNGWRQPPSGYHVVNSEQNKKWGAGAPCQFVYDHYVLPFLRHAKEGRALDLACGLDGPTIIHNFGLSDRVDFVDADIHLPQDLGIIRRDRRDTGLPRHNYDLIVSILGMFKRYAEDSVREMRELIKNSGKIIVVESHKDKKWVKYTLPTLFEKYGFVAKVENLGDDTRRFRLYELTVRS